ncbi:extensin family protein [Cognatiyoonia sp. IB215446]|uniref:extensin-like domain-containing protein n=1 Tax=Cognatiyoonia sp. IB215446 TaxID=3097355 RepID=UPI002A16D0AE|nr:extensin family protein [Cognatiyoonia sp. IB215446]MDX8349323.1 extensin family protein [Cognatiyoonia sp. IB215446]
MRHARRQAMAQDAAKQTRKNKGRSLALIRGLAAFVFVGVLGFGLYQLLVHPGTPLPPHWNPTKPLVVSQPVTALTEWKLNRALASTESCLTTIEGFAALQPMSDFRESDQCGITGRVNLRAVGETRMSPIETRCAIALRMAMWERHGLQPAARDILGTTLARVDQSGSYNCRTIRTTSGPSERMSTHATADAIDISGFAFADGRQISLLRDWDGAGPEAAFLRAARDSACDWFRVTLSPDFNALHADHFHLQSVGWGLCR